MYRISYNMNGLRSTPMKTAIEMMAQCGYRDVEINLHANHIHPMTYTEEDIRKLTEILRANHMNPACIATGGPFLLTEEQYEPSLICADEKGRDERIQALKNTVDIARKIGAKVINFPSGFLKEGMNPDNCYRYLKEGILSCLTYAKGDVIFAIEPEPGMFIETTEQARKLIDEIASDYFKLNLDLGHVVCCEPDLYETIQKMMDITVHIHIEDIKDRVHYHLIPGDGDMDFNKILKMLFDYGYEGAISLELYHHDNVPMEALKRSYDYLSNIMNQIEREGV